MVGKQVDSDASTASRIDGHKLSEFIYGTVTGMVAISGINGDQQASWLGTASVIIVGAVAIWLAHAYSTLISKRVVAGHRLDVHELGETLAESWPIVSAGVLLAIPLIPVAAGLWTLDFALWAAKLTGISILALIGILAGTITKDSWSHRILLAALSAGLGIAVVAVEFAVHH